MPDAGEVDPHQPLPFTGRVPVGVRHAAGTGVVVHDAEPAEVAGGGVDHGIEGSGISDVHLERHSSDLFGHLLRGLAVDVGNCYRRAFFDHPPGGRSPDARATTRHDRSMTRQQRHGETLEVRGSKRHWETGLSCAAYAGHNCFTAAEMIAPRSWGGRLCPPLSSIRSAICCVLALARNPSQTTLPSFTTLPSLRYCPMSLAFRWTLSM